MNKQSPAEAEFPHSLQLRTLRAKIAAWMTTNGANRIRQLGEECFHVDDFSISTEIDDERTAAGFAVALAASMHAEGDLGDETHSSFADDVNALSGLLLTLDLKSLIDGLTPVPNSEGNLRDWPDTRTLSLKQRKALEAHVRNWEASSLQNPESVSRRADEREIDVAKAESDTPPLGHEADQWLRSGEIAGRKSEQRSQEALRKAIIHVSPNKLFMVDDEGRCARRDSPNGWWRYWTGSLTGQLKTDSKSVKA